jgi:hypothetical protein
MNRHTGTVHFGKRLIAKFQRDPGHHRDKGKLNASDLHDIASLPLPESCDNLDLT